MGWMRFHGEREIGRMARSRSSPWSPGLFVGGMLVVLTGWIVPRVAAAPAGLFITDADLRRLRAEYAAPPDADVRKSCRAQEQTARRALDDVADPFVMEDASQITFHWCSPDRDGIDNSLADATQHIEQQSHAMRALALQFALTKDKRWANKALELMRTWAGRHTPVNVYDFHPDFQAASIDGMTQGYCSDRPWNFALDAMWQCYGLINVSDAYLLLTRNGCALSGADKQLLEAWILRMAQAVNSSFHAWTKYADLHPDGSAYERYRSDNHLSWILPGLLAAGVALEDAPLISYVIDGGVWDDGRSGPYANPSPIPDVIDRAIEPDGRVYEEKIERRPPLGYSLFHLQAMVLIARIDEVHGPGQVRNLEGRDGAGLMKALIRYAPHVIDPVDEKSLINYAWLYYLADRWWPGRADFGKVWAKAAPAQMIRPAAGPVRLLFEERQGQKR